MMVFLYEDVRIIEFGTSGLTNSHLAQIGNERAAEVDSNMLEPLQGPTIRINIRNYHFNIRN